MRVEPPRPATPAQIHDLARHFQADRVICHLDVDPALALAILLPMALGDFSDWTPEDLAKEVVVFGVSGQQADAGMSLNGYPVFTEVGVWLLEDYLSAAKLAQQAQDGLAREA